MVLAWCGLLLALAATTGERAWVLLMATTFTVAVAGFADDLRDLPARLRLVVHGVAAVVFLLALWPISIDLGAWRFPGTIAWLPVLLVVFVAACNFYNFMDGINGIAATEAIFSGGLLGLLAAAAGDAPLAVACLGLAAAAAGFLPWNFPHARVFMGDVGSTALGFAFAALGVLGAIRGAWSLLLPALVLSLFIVDALATVLARMARGARWYTAHREHAYQRLAARGWSHGSVTGSFALLNLALVAPVVWFTRDSGAVQPLAGIALWGVLALLWRLARRS